MTVTFSLAPEPIWIFINNEGTAAGGAKMYTRRSLNKIQDKAVYTDSGGGEAWSNPIDIDMNGTQGPFYFKFDSDHPEETYYIFVKDSNGTQIWDADDFSPGSGGGGSVVTNFISIKNYITNNQVIDHIADQAGPLTTNLVIAPSNHKGFTPSLVNPVVGTYGVLGSDIRFIKNNTSATDSLSFPLFSLSSAPLTGDVTPVDYIRYVSNAGSGETYKCFQFPITQKVKNLSNQDVTFTIWAAVTTTPVTINIYSRQYYGSGTGATAESTSTRPLVGSCALTTTWTPFTIHFTIPNVSGNSIGTPNLQTNDDALYIQVEMPLDASCDVLFTKPCLFLETIDPDLEFDSYDEIDSVNSTPRTGDVKTSLLSSAPLGWLAMNDTTIGNTSSGATTSGAHLFQLYKTIWDGVLDAWAPVSTGMRGATATADFLAGKTLTLPRSLGRALAGAGSGFGLTARELGQYLGEETHTLTIPEIPAHTHTPISALNSFMVAGAGSADVVGGGNIGTQGITGSTGGSGSHNNMQPTSFFNVFIKI